MDRQTDLGSMTQVSFSLHVNMSIIAGGIQHVLVYSVWGIYPRNYLGAQAAELPSTCQDIRQA